MIGAILRSRHEHAVTVFTIHERPDPPADRIERAESLVFVKDGFSWGALFFGPIWLAANGMWLVLLGYLGLLGTVGFAFHALGLPPHWTVVFYQALAILLAFEGSSLKRWTLEMRGYTAIGTVVGRNQAECERRFFESWLPAQPILRVDGSTRSPSQMEATARAAAAEDHAAARNAPPPTGHSEGPAQRVAGRWWPFATKST